jgi:hypothetical protein
LQQPRPFEMEPGFGRRLLQQIFEREGTVDPARQHYFVQNARTGFHDPHDSHRRALAGPGSVPWQMDTSHHLGYLPLNLKGVAWNPKFKQVLEDLTRQFLEALKSHQNKQLDMAPVHLHVLFWCDQGCHSSVSLCRLLQVAAASWGWRPQSSII